MARNVRSTGKAEGAVLLSAMVMMGIGLIGLVMFIGGIPVPFYNNAIVPGWMLNKVIHGYAVFLGVTGWWLWKVVASNFEYRCTIEDLQDHIRTLEGEKGVNKNVIEQ